MLGLAELTKIAAFADSLGSVEVLDFEKQAPHVITCHMVGARLAYSVSLDIDGSFWCWVSSADNADLPQRILSGVSHTDWKVIARCITAFEYSKVASVAERPFEVT